LNKGVILIISQVYPPDPASVGQHLHDVSKELVQRGYRVRVYAADRGYDDPSKHYERRELRDGVEIQRIRWSSFGKDSIAKRLLGQGLFVAQAFVKSLLVGGVKGLLVSTSPPFCGAVGAWVSRLKGVPVKYWLMDLNPDQMVAMGKAKPDSLSVRVFDALNRMILRRASDIVMLDRFMLERVERKGVAVRDKTTIAPPWPHEDELLRIEHEDNPFRAKQGMGVGESAKFVLMYSGNHSPANPLRTLLDAAERMRNEPRFVLYCIGGGGGKKEVDERIAAGATNIVSLPYQPFSEIKYSLSSADAHVVSIGNDVVGIVHPCKIYGAMAVSRPILALGPKPSHVSDLIEQHGVGWHIEHGDVDGCERALRQMLAMPREQLRAMGERGARAVSQSLSKRTLCAQFVDVVERGIRAEQPAHATGSKA
jgi:glycosyltransferase involved in cell wall biosynthesis